MKCKYCGREMEFDCIGSQTTCYSCLCGAEYYTPESGASKWFSPEKIDIKKASSKIVLQIEDVFDVRTSNAMKQGNVSFTDECGNVYEIIKHLVPHYDVHFRYNATPNVTEIEHCLNAKEVNEYLQRKDIKILQIILKDGEIND